MAKLSTQPIAAEQRQSSLQRKNVVQRIRQLAAAAAAVTAAAAVGKRAAEQWSSGYEQPAADRAAPSSS